MADVGWNIADNCRWTRWVLDGDVDHADDECDNNYTMVKRMRSASMAIIIPIGMQMVLLIMMFMMVLPDNDTVDHVDLCVGRGQNKHDDEEGGGGE